MHRANVLDSPANALVHLREVLASQPLFPPLAAGEIVTTGTVTAAWPVAQGETWTSDYGGTRIFGTTLGHGNDTWNDPVFQDLLGRAFKWTLKRE